MIVSSWRINEERMFSNESTWLISLVCAGTAAQIGRLLPPLLPSTANAVLSAWLLERVPMLQEWVDTHSLEPAKTSFALLNTVAVLGGTRTNMLTGWLKSR
jgi:hypothetical protein